MIPSIGQRVLLHTVSGQDVAAIVTQVHESGDVSLTCFPPDAATYSTRATEGLTAGQWSPLVDELVDDDEPLPGDEWKR